MAIQRQGESVSSCRRMLNSRSTVPLLLLCLYALFILMQSVFPCSYIPYFCFQQRSDSSDHSVLRHTTHIEHQLTLKFGEDEARRDILSVAVCITGQKARLELASKLKHVFNESAIIFDIILVLSNDTATFTNNAYKGTASADLSEIDAQLDLLVEKARHVKYVTDIQPERPLLNPSFYMGFDKNESVSGKKFRAKNDVSQYLKLQKCYREIERFEAHNGRPYDALFRIRDDLFVFKKLPLLDILDKMEGKTVVGAKCDRWHGINDKLAIVNRPAGSDYFDGPIKYQYFFPNKLIWKPIINSETFLYRMLSASKVKIDLVGPEVLPLAPSLVSTNQWKACLKLYDTSFACLAEGHPDMQETLKLMRCPRATPKKL